MVFVCFVNSASRCFIHFIPFLPADFVNCESMGAPAEITTSSCFWRYRRNGSPGVEMCRVLDLFMTWVSFLEVFDVVNWLWTEISLHTCITISGWNQAKPSIDVPSLFSVTGRMIGIGNHQHSWPCELWNDSPRLLEAFFRGQECKYVLLQAAVFWLLLFFKMFFLGKNLVRCAVGPKRLRSPRATLIIL